MDSKETRGARIQSNRAAMFGLDARIALAIFGALSVISGAALYSAIQSAKTEQYNQYFRELVKASEQYLLDTGSHVPMQGATTYVARSSDLVTDSLSLSTWQGPYIAGTAVSNAIKDTTTASVDAAAHLQTVLLVNSTWAANNAMQVCSAIGNADCSEYLILYSGNTASGVANIQNMFDNLDSVVDNGDGALAGNIRYVDRSGNDDFLAYKGIPRKRTQ